MDCNNLTIALVICCNKLEKKSVQCEILALCSSMKMILYINLENGVLRRETDAIFVTIGR